MSFNPGLLLDHLPELAQGFALTLITWVCGTIIAVALGFGLAVLQTVPGTVHQSIIRIYTDIVRGVPFIVQLFLVYYGGPHIGLRGDALVVGTVMLGIYGSPYFCEIFRGGFASVPVGYIEAARSVGLRRSTIVMRIILPQMLVVTLPSIINLTIVLLKESTVLSVITVPELTYHVSGISSDTFAFAECFLVLALVYWALVEITIITGRHAERRVMKFMQR